MDSVLRPSEVAFREAEYRNTIQGSEGALAPTWTPELVVAIGGESGTGKSTVARRLAQVLGARVVAFASRLRTVVTLGFGLGWEHVSTHKDCEFPKTTRQAFRTTTIHQLHALVQNMSVVVPLPSEGDKLAAVLEFLQVGLSECQTPRDILKLVGGMYCEVCGPEVWCEALRRDVALYDVRRVVIDDMRLPAEREFARRHGGHLVRLRCGDQVPGSHATELSFGDDSEYHIVAEAPKGDVEGLLAQVAQGLGARGVCP